jgi:hypothetical protein
MGNTLGHPHVDCKSVGLRLQWFESTTCHRDQTEHERAGTPRAHVGVLIDTRNAGPAQRLARVGGWRGC